MQKVIVIHALLRPESAPPWRDALLRALPYAKRLELEGRLPADRSAALAGLALALAAASRASNADVSPGEWVFPAGAKPFFRNGPFFSISHTEARVLCAACGSGDVGVDAEEIPPASAPEVMSKLERWTATEAALKAAGMGLRDARQVSLDADLQFAHVVGTRYTLQRLPLASTVVSHLASPVPAAVSIETIALEGDEIAALVERSLRLAAQSC